MESTIPRNAFTKESPRCCCHPVGDNLLDDTPCSCSLELERRAVSRFQDMAAALWDCGSYCKDGSDAVELPSFCLAQLSWLAWPWRWTCTLYAEDRGLFK